MIYRLGAAIHKELLILWRDWHSLLVLFVMPSIFVLVMSLALPGQIDKKNPVSLSGWIRIPPSLQQPADTNLQAFLQALTLQPELHLTQTDEHPQLSTQDRLFLLEILPEFNLALAGSEGDDVAAASLVGAKLYFAPELPAPDRTLIQAAIAQAFARFNTELIAADLGFDRDYAHQQLLKEGFFQIVDSTPGITTPNAVQQSVSAWLIFGMFFIAIPFSTTMIQERQYKTLARLRTCGLPLWLIYLGKLLPYGLINQVQLLLMLALGCWLLPLLGSQGLSLNLSLGALALISLCTSVAALGWASLIAASVRTLEQATIVSGGANIIMAALGGIMIPRFVMPPVMQEFSLISPMAWALEGFLTVLVRAGSYAAIATHCLVLATLGGLLAALALLISYRSNDHD